MSVPSCSYVMTTGCILFFTLVKYRSILLVCKVGKPLKNTVGEGLDVDIPYESGYPQFV